MYQNPYSYQYQNYPSFQNQPTADERIWVQSEAAAEAYLVAPNSFVRLWDANRPVFYEKRSDATGRPLPISTYEYALRTPKEEKVLTGGYDFKKELEEIKQRLDTLERREEDGQSDADDTDV